MTPAPALIACAHGTRDPDGRRAVARLVQAVGRARPQVQVREAFVDVQQPAVAPVVDRTVTDHPGRRAVVVPLLLSAGFHVHVDVAAAVAPHPGRAVAADALGPDPRLVEILQDRLLAAGASPRDAVVLAAAGSSDPRAARAVQTVAEALAQARGNDVAVGYGSAGRPTVPQAVSAARARTAGRVVVAAYLLAPGHFHRRLAASGADLVTAALAPDPRLVDVVLDRFDDAAARLGRPGEDSPGTGRSG